MSAYREFTGKSVEEALRNARDAFGASLDDLDFEILTPGSRGVLGMGAEPARIVAAPRSALGGAAPKRDAAASVATAPSRRGRTARPATAVRGPTIAAPAATIVARDQPNGPIVRRTTAGATVLPEIDRHGATTPTGPTGRPHPRPTAPWTRPSIAARSAPSRPAARVGHRAARMSRTVRTTAAVPRADRRSSRDGATVAGIRIVAEDAIATQAAAGPRAATVLAAMPELRVARLAAPIVGQPGHPDEVHVMPVQRPPAST